MAAFACLAPLIALPPCSAIRVSEPPAAAAARTPQIIAELESEQITLGEPVTIVLRPSSPAGNATLSALWRTPKQLTVALVPVAKVAGDEPPHPVAVCEVGPLEQEAAARRSPEARFLRTDWDLRFDEDGVTPILRIVLSGKRLPVPEGGRYRVVLKEWPASVGTHHADPTELSLPLTVVRDPKRMAEVADRLRAKVLDAEFHFIYEGDEVVELFSLSGPEARRAQHTLMNTLMDYPNDQVQRRRFQGVLRKLSQMGTPEAIDFLAERTWNTGGYRPVGQSALAYIHYHGDAATRKRIEEMFSSRGEKVPAPILDL